MQQTRIMTLKEKLDICMKSIEMEKQGREEEARQFRKRELPLPHYTAKWAKDHLGADYLIQGGWNLTEAEAEFGRGWLTR